MANGREASDVVLWRDSAPASVSIELRPKDAAKPELKLWNVWRGGFDVTQAWSGNAAIQVAGDLASRSFLIPCGDGQGDPTFDDSWWRLRPTEARCAPPCGSRLADTEFPIDARGLDFRNEMLIQRRSGIADSKRL